MLALLRKNGIRPLVPSAIYRNLDQIVSTDRRSFGSEIIPDEHLSEEIRVVGAYTPVTKRLWQRRFRWDTTAISQAHPQQHFTPKPPNSIEVIYPFSTDFVLREHYRNPWNGVRIGRMLEDADSLAGFVSYEHCDDTNPTTRPPLLVTATVEAIKLTGSDLSLEHDMTLRGKVVWTGTSSLDINMELIQHGVHKMSALFTFVARDPVTGASQRVNPLKPEKPQDQEVFCERQRVNDVRKSERTAIKQGKSVLNSPEIQQYIADLLASARTKRELPALAEPHTLFADQTMCSNTFTTQPQQRNLHGRVFGGFLMRRAFELAHSTAYQFAGCRPRTLLIDQIEFRKPVNIGDLLRLNAWVLHTRPHPKEPHSKGVLHVQVQASVTNPEKLQSTITNTFNFIFSYDLRKVPSLGVLNAPTSSSEDNNTESSTIDESNNRIKHHHHHVVVQAPIKILPSTEEQAAEIALYYGPQSSSKRHELSRTLGLDDYGDDE